MKTPFLNPQLAAGLNLFAAWPAFVALPLLLDIAPACGNAGARLASDTTPTTDFSAPAPLDFLNSL